MINNAIVTIRTSSKGAALYFYSCFHLSFASFPHMWLGLFLIALMSIFDVASRDHPLCTMYYVMLQNQLCGILNTEHEPLECSAVKPSDWVCGIVNISELNVVKTFHPPLVFIHSLPVKTRNILNKDSATQRTVRRKLMFYLVTWYLVWLLKMQEAQPEKGPSGNWWQEPLDWCLLLYSSRCS